VSGGVEGKRKEMKTPKIRREGELWLLRKILKEIIVVGKDGVDASAGKGKEADRTQRGRRQLYCQKKNLSY